MGKIKNFFGGDDAAQLQKRGFSISGELGEGTYSKVKQASWNKEEGCTLKIALKIINKKTAPKDFLEKFLPREMEVMKQIKHPNLIRLFELFQISSKLYFVLEWAGHGDLLQYIRLCGPLKDETCRLFFQQLCSGVRYLHDIGIVHRDLKCENILLTKKQVVKIADFGFARLIGARDLSKTYCGSAAYAAPELLQGIPYHGPIADLWSLGVILYIMACASMPFRDSSIKVLLKDQKESLHIPSSQIKEFSPILRDLLSKTMEFDLAKRYDMSKITSHPWYVGGTPKDSKSAQPSTSSKNPSVSIKKINSNPKPRNSEASSSSKPSSSRGTAAVA